MWAAWVSNIRRCGLLILERAAKLGSQHFLAAWVSNVRRCGLLILNSREGSQVGFLTFVGSVGFYCQEMWASDSREVSQVGVLTFVGSMGF